MSLVNIFGGLKIIFDIYFLECTTDINKKYYLTTYGVFQIAKKTLIPLINI